MTTLFDTVHHILTKRVEESYGVETFVGVDAAHSVILVNRMVGTGVHRIVDVEAIVRVQEDVIILEYDDVVEYQRLLQNDYPLESTVLYALLQAGIPRSQIVVAYRNEPTPA